jgi:hypothetical protein
MQTFVPLTSSVDDIAKVLDNKRLNKQILEGYQILKVLSNDDPRAGWRNHPAVKMWRGHELALWDYVFECVAEADIRGIKTDKNVENLQALRAVAEFRWGAGLPEWFSDQPVLNRVVTTHRANLYTKDPYYYDHFVTSVASEWNEPCCEKCNYYWVTHVA